MWLGNGTFACTVQLSDKHRCAPFDWPDAENAIVLLHFILYFSKCLDSLHLSYTGSYNRILSVAAGISSWLCFSVTFWLSELWLKLNRISMFSSSSLLTVSVPEVLCMAGEKRIKNKKDSESAMLSVTFNSNCNFAKNNPTPESLQSILASKHLCLSHLQEKLLLFQISFCWNPHVLFLSQLLLTTLILHFWSV